MSIVLVIPDTHLPFEHKDALAFVKAAQKKYKPDEIVHLGDFEDWHSISMHDHSPDGMGAGDELQAMRIKAKPWFRAFPNVKMCTSNHGSLPFRRAFKFGLPSELIKSYKDILQAPKGWEWADAWEIDGILYEHGDPFSGQNGAIKSAEQNMQSTVIGHIHSFAGIQFSANSRHLIYGFNVGCLIDRHAYAFEYAKKIKRKPILGCGIVNNGVPTFLPMPLDARGRWTGKLP